MRSVQSYIGFICVSYLNAFGIRHSIYLHFFVTSFSLRGEWWLLLKCTDVHIVCNEDLGDKPGKHRSCG